MRVQAIEPGPLQALNLVLHSIESVRNGRAQYLLLLTFAVSGLLVSLVQAALVAGQGLSAALWGGTAFFTIFYGTSAAGLVLMDEARGRPSRHPMRALTDALGLAHRLLLVVLLVLLMALLVAALFAALLQATRVPALSSAAMGLAVALGVPGMGLLALVMVTLVGPIAAPAVWFGLGVRDTLAMIQRQIRRRLAHAVLLSAAVSLLTAAVAGLVSFVVLAGGRAISAMAISLAGADLAPEPVLAALFGTGLRDAPGAAALSPLTSAAITGAGLVFALGLVVPGAVYLRGLCQVFLALRGLDQAWDSPRLSADVAEAAGAGEAPCAATTELAGAAYAAGPDATPTAWFTPGPAAAPAPAPPTAPSPPPAPSA